MKKLSTIFVICLALFVSVFFGACGSKYKNLDMYFMTKEDCIQLILDDEYWDNKNVLEEARDVKYATTVKVKIGGIKKKYIGKLDIKVIPSDLAVIKENEVVDDVLHFNIYASRPGTGEIEVTHLSSGKSVSITLDVDKKAIDANYKGNGIVLNIPDNNDDGSEKFYSFTIDPTKVLNYNPIDATDDVYWEIVDNSLDSNNRTKIEVGNFSEDDKSDDVCNQVKISSKATADTFYITPTLKVEGYEDISLKDIKVPVSVIKVIDETNVNVLSKNAIIEKPDKAEKIDDYKVIKSPVYLFTNSLPYSTAKIYLHSVNNVNLFESEDYNRFYTYQIRTSSSQIYAAVNNVDKCIDVTGVDYNKNLQWFEIEFTPNNCVGDIKSFTIRQDIVLTEVADKISMKMDNEPVSISTNVEGNSTVDIDLLDYYAKYGNLGQKFNFNVLRTSTHSCLKSLRIIVDSKFYDPNYNAENYEGNSSKNQYLLTFKKGNNNLNFDLSSNGYYYSETFTASDNLYIKYVYNPIGVNHGDLNFKVANVYSDELFGESSIQNTEKSVDIHINRARGIKSMNLTGANIVSTESVHNYNSNGKQFMYVLNSAITNVNILDFDNEKFTVKDKEVAYGVNIDSIQGTTSITDEDIKDVNFKCTVYKDDIKVDYFDFGLFNSKEHKGYITEGERFTLDSISAGVNNVLLLIRKDGVLIPNGEYVVEISEPIGGYKATFTYNVVTNVTVHDADVTPFNKNDITPYNKIYSSKDYQNYLFGALTSEQETALESYLGRTYIVPTNQSIDTNVRLGRVIDGDFVIDNSFVPSVTDIRVTTKPVEFVYDTTEKVYKEQDVELMNVKYVSNDRDGLVGDFKFDIKLQTGEYGTVHNGQKYFIKVTYNIYSDKYEKIGNFYEKVKQDVAENEPTTLDFYFFIYVELKETKFENDASIINTYFYGDLGHYLKSEGENELKLSLPNQYKKEQSLFDYVDYRWIINVDDESDFDYEEDKSNHSFKFSLVKPNRGPASYRDRIIKAEITQFGVRRTIISTIHVHKVELTAKLLVRNSLNYLDASDSYYVYLKADQLENGGGFTFDVEQVGSHTFNGVKYVVSDVAGNSLYGKYEIDENGVFKYIGEEEFKAQDLKVLIFATDWVTRNLDSTINTYDFNDLSYYTFNTGGINYSDRVKIIDVKIRDGSEYSPYLIANGSDFADIDKHLDKHYEIVNDINLNGKESLITDFAGSLQSYKDYKMLTSKPSDWADTYKHYYTFSNGKFIQVPEGVIPTFTYRKFYKLNQNIYTVYNILFEKEFNLFDSVTATGKISNIAFRIGFNNASSNVGYIGLITTNYGTLTNVKVEYSGNLTIDSIPEGSAAIYVGMLVAKNQGNVEYNDTSTAYSVGNVKITDKVSKPVYIGGLVGENSGIIKGMVLDSNIETTEYVIFYDNQGSLFDGTIQVVTTNTNLALGGVVGFNNNGTIKEVYTSGKLIGYNNVGGLIGKNSQESVIDVRSEDAKIADCLSTTQIIANENVGGVTGNDSNGSYYHVYYEVYDNNKKVDENAYAIKGNSYVGGLIGYGSYSQLNYCYFHSFRWDYKFDDTNFNNSEFNEQTPDIYATQYVGGLFGYASSMNNGNHLAGVESAVHITNSVVDAYFSGDINLTGDFTYVGGLIGFADGYAVAQNVYVQGAFIGNSNDVYYDMQVNYSEKYKSMKNYYSITFGNVYDNVSGITITFNEITSIAENSNAFVTNADINNNRPYIELNGYPLITQAPTAIILDNALNGSFDRGTNILNDDSNIGNEGTTYTDKILIYYYNLINNNQQNYINDSASVNVINLDEIIIKGAIELLPESIKGARIKVTSSNENVVVITASGYIKLVGEGQTTLRFASIINSKVYDEITVIVRAKPSDYNIYKNSSKNEELDDGSISIVKDESKFIYENYVGETYVNGTKYLYNTTNDVAVFVNVDNKDGNILINGVTYNNAIEDNSVSFEGKQPIIVSVLNYSDTAYTVTMASYIKFEIDGQVYYVKVIEEERKFTVITKRGITKINTNVTDAVMSVADSLNVDLSIDTDNDINKVNIEVDVRDQNGNIKKVYDNAGNEINNNQLFIYNNEFDTQFDIDRTGLYEFVLRLNQNVRVAQDLFATITFSAGKVKTVMNLTLIPQKITSIVANAYKQNETSWKSSSVIRPGEAGMFVINVSPDTAYFEYLEITDTTSEEKITFIQWSDFNANKKGLAGNGMALNEVDTPSSDGFGIKLVKTDKKSFYVYALLSKYAINSVGHEIMVTAYSSSGYILGSSTVNLEAMLYPTVILSYYNERDEIEITADSRDDIQNTKTDLASGIQAKIGVTTYNTDGSFDNASWKIKVEDVNNNVYTELSKSLSMELSENGYWYLTYNKTLSLSNLNKLVNDLVGKTVTITATVRQVTKGYEEQDSASLTFNFKRFTLNGISAQTARQTSGNRLGGIVNEETYIEFYFNNTHNKDISYYQNGEYFNKNYFVDFNNDNDDKINNILKEVNNFTDSENVIIKLVRGQEEINLSDIMKDKTEYVHIVNGDVDLFKVTKDTNDLTKFVAYSNSINNYTLQIIIKYYYDANGEVVLGKDNTNNGYYQTCTTSYGLNFVTNSSPIKYYPIKNSEEFMNMVAGQYYILINDITLKNYKMLDVKLGGFDGNGHTITIDNYDYDSLSSIANATTGYLGLFKQIYAGEIVENLVVEYKYSENHYNLSDHYASDNKKYTEFYFGGISAINEGIITNCKVVGKVYLQASDISPASFLLGGLTATNETTGYITNSSVELKISAGGIIGGVVNTNNGKIVSTNFLGAVQAYTTTNASLSNEINAALFAVNNSGEISMSYVSPKLSTTEGEKYEANTGIINSGGSLGGFVYVNSGTIFDCYLKDITFSSRGKMGGFVYSSTGTIERCYINSNDTLQGDRYVDIFVYEKGKGTFKDCYYILTENLKSQVEGIKCITELNINKESFYNNYAFNAQGYNVWQMSSDGPVLPSVGANIHSKNVKIKVENGVEKIEYSISGTKEIPYVIYDVDSFTYWFGLAEDGVVYGYFRFVSDIDFSTLKEIIVTSNKEFGGTIEGNNMILSNFSLFVPKDEEIDSVGLFKEIEHIRKTNFVNNLILKCESVRASSASCVGILAGIINGANIYSIKIDNPNLVVLGKNAVGGLAGVIKGDFVVENITSNVSVNATFRQTYLSKVNIYNGRYNTGNNTSNISEVSYAGGIAGIVEGYDYRVNSSVILNNYYAVKNSVVSGDIVLIAETAGGMFGFVNERARITNARFEAGDETYIKGVYYSGGLVGENRGIIDNAIVLASEENITLFDAELDGALANCVGGIVAVNYSGLIYKCVNNANVVNMYVLSTAGGIVGRNVGGSINYCENKGLVYGFFTGNISGSDYSYQVLLNAGNSAGTMTSSTITAINRQEAYEKIEFNGNKVEYGYVTTLESLDAWYLIQKDRLSKINKAISSYFTHSRGEDKNPYDIKLEYFRILGAVTGITDKNLEYDMTEVDKVVLSYNNTQFIKIVKASGDNIEETEFVGTEKNLPAGETNPEIMYSPLQEGIKNEAISEYYYLVPVYNESAYNFYNLTQNGYKDAYARVYTTK